MDGTPLLGTLRSWKEPWGFIVCPASFEGDLFCHKEAFTGPIPRGDLTGSTVQFECATDAKGRNHAANVIVLELGPGGTFREKPSGPMASSSTALPMRSLPLAPPPPPPALAAGVRTFRVAAPAVAPSSSSRANPEQLQHLLGALLRGEVRSWKEDWGFLICPQRFSGDLFAHKQNLRMEGLPVAGQPVTFKIILDARGRPAATEISDRPPGPEDFVGNGQLQGEIRSWKREWGFVIAPDYFPGDVFCHKENLFLGTDLEEQLWERAMPGRAVSFEVAVDKKGRVCASNVLLLEPLPPAAALATAGPCGVPPGSLGDTVDENPGYGETSEVLEGSIRSWKEPWGFIICPSAFEGDLFCHREAFVHHVAQQDLAGCAVRFRSAVDGKGRAHATEVQVLGPAIPLDPGTRAGQATVPVVRTQPVRPDGEVGVLVQNPKFESLLGQPLVGVVRSWKDEWGFVVAPEHFDGDLFVHREHLEEGAVGLIPDARVSFQVGIDVKGRATALNVKCLSTVKDWVGTGQPLRGTIRSWKEPWGFIVSPGAFSGDLFFHCDRALQQFLQVEHGREVVFTVEMDSRGRCTAKDLRPADPALPGPTGVKRGAPPTALGGIAALKRVRI